MSFWSFNGKNGTDKCLKYFEDKLKTENKKYESGN